MDLLKISKQQTSQRISVEKSEQKLKIRNNLHCISPLLINSSYTIHTSKSPQKTSFIENAITKLKLKLTERIFNLKRHNI